MVPDLAETLEIVGHIGKRRLGVGTVELTTWRAAYEDEPELEHAPPRPARDPSTGKDFALDMPAESRAIRRDGEWIGWFDWNPMSDETNQSGVVTVCASVDAKVEMMQLAKQLAGIMNSKFVSRKWWQFG